MTKLLVNGEEQDVDLQPDKLFVKINGEYYVKTINIEKEILTELEEYLNQKLIQHDLHEYQKLAYQNISLRIKELKEKYK